MSKRGISPLIATVLLIGFTIVLSILVVTWVSNVVEQLTEGTTSNVQSQNQCLDSIGDLSASFTSTGGVGPYAIQVVNSGNVDFDIVQIIWQSSAGNTLTTNVTGLVGFSSASSSTTGATVYEDVILIPIIGNVECKRIELEIPTNITAPGPVCGDGVCDAGETCSSCIEDCEGEQSICAYMQVCSPYDNTGALDPTCAPVCASGNGWCSFQSCPPSHTEDPQASESGCQPAGYGECCLVP